MKSCTMLLALSVVVISSGAAFAQNPVKVAATHYTVDGTPAKTTWQRGDVQFIGRGVAHESKNTGGKPTDFVIVAIK